MPELEIPKLRPIERPDTSLLRIVTKKIVIGPDRIDEYRHFNNAGFPEEFERARDLYARAILGQSSRQLAEHSRLIPAVQFSINGIPQQVREHETITIETGALPEGRGSSLIFAQSMHRGKELVAYMLSRIVMINEQGKPTRVPTEILAIINQANKAHQDRQALLAN